MKRAWFQIHLSTAIVLMFAAGGFLLLNATSRSDRVFRGCLSDLGAYEIQSYGWPGAALWTFVENRGSNLRLSHLDNYSLVLNACFLVIVLTATAAVCEWLARRKPLDPKSEIENPK